MSEEKRKTLSEIIKDVDEDMVEYIKDAPLSLNEKMYYVYSCVLGEFDEEMEEDFEYVVDLRETLESNTEELGGNKELDEELRESNEEIRQELLEIDREKTKELPGLSARIQSIIRRAAGEENVDTQEIKTRVIKEMIALSKIMKNESVKKVLDYAEKKPIQPKASEKIRNSNASKEKRMPEKKSGFFELFKNKMLGEFRILETLGSGGFGTVYKVKHPDGEIFAAKVPDGGILKFKEEISTLEGLLHPNIVSFRGAHEDDKPPFYLMEYISQGSLEDATKPIDLNLALIIMHQVLEGLKYTHSKNIIHGDIKPSNILLGDQAKLSDFGLVSKSDPESFFNTLSVVSENIAGTWDYMSPEQKAGVIDKRNDIYSVGVVFYQILTNRLLTNVRKPSEINPDVPQSVDQIVLRALADIDERYQTAKEFCDDVAALLKKNPASRIKDCLAARYVPANMVPKDKKIYEPYIKKIIEKIKSRLQGTVKKEARKALGCNDKSGEILSERADIQIKGYTINNDLGLQYYPVELREDGTTYRNKHNIVNSTRPGTEGFLIKRAIEICRMNNDWDVSPEEGSRIVGPNKDVKFEEPVWFYPKNYLSVDLEFNIDVRYEVRNKWGLSGEELKRATVRKVWRANEDYQTKVQIFFSGTEEYWDNINSIKLDDLELRCVESEVDCKTRPKVPYYVTVPAGCLGALVGYLFAKAGSGNTALGLAASAVFATAAAYASWFIYDNKFESEQIARDKKRTQEIKDLKSHVSSDLKKKVSISQGSCSGLCR